MREILFRGKRVDNGEWIEGGILQTENWASIYVCKDYQGSMNEPPCCDVEEYEVIPKTVGQYTSLTDKNGKKIFEGDIIQFCTGMKLHYIVEFGLGGFMVSRYDIRDAIINVYNCPCEVIGNIHDNPELLKEDDDK